jgi:hypothetical protein
LYVIHVHDHERDKAMHLVQPDGFASSLQPAPLLPRLSARSVTQPPRTGRHDERERFMRRTVLSALALAATAVLASTVPAFADSATPSPAPTSRPTATEPAPSATPSAEPTRAPSSAAPAPSASPSRAPGNGQVSVVPSGAPDTGVTATSSDSSGNEGGLIGGGAAAVLLAGGGTVFVVRRRRATGA